MATETRAEIPAPDHSGLRTAALSLLLVLTLILMWEGAKAFGAANDYALTVGGTTIDLSILTDTQLPHLTDILRAFVRTRPTQRRSALPDAFPERAVYLSGGAARLFARRRDRLRAGDPLRALVAASARAAAVRRRLADRADSGDCADGRDLDEPDRRGRVVGADDRRLSDLLPGRDLHAARLDLRAANRRSN